MFTRILFCFVLTVLLFTCPIQSLVLSTPSNVDACSPIVITWSGGAAPYTLTYGGQRSPTRNAIASNITDTQYSWAIPDGDEDIVLAVSDSTGTTAKSSQFDVDDCENENSNLTKSSSKTTSRFGSEHTASTSSTSTISAFSTTSSTATQKQAALNSSIIGGIVIGSLFALLLLGLTIRWLLLRKRNRSNITSPPSNPIFGPETQKLRLLNHPVQSQDYPHGVEGTTALLSPAQDNETKLELQRGYLNAYASISSTISSQEPTTSSSPSQDVNRLMVRVSRLEEELGRVQNEVDGPPQYDTELEEHRQRTDELELPNPWDRLKI
ncbi:hypothetical protein DL96DRAFT_1705736 [Flagelloscypha sp. PMI_526]|nr:hypothetical protein DL96DRAFT_1705736 [Flagelloscypha sp. PMI_526]